jgi:hypothetical protein
MKENFDPHQVVISREYFDKLIEMAQPNDHTAGRPTHPNQTILARILWHARKFNRHLHNERQVEVETDLVSKRMKRNWRMKIVKKYAGTREKVYVIEGDNDWPAIVCGASRRNKLGIRVMITRGHKCSFEIVLAENIILTPRPL